MHRSRYAILIVSLLLVWMLPPPAAAQQHYTLTNCATASFRWDAPTTWGDGAALSASQILWYKVHVAHTQGLYEPENVLLTLKNDTTTMSCAALSQAMGEDWQANRTYWMRVAVEAKETSASPLVVSPLSNEISFILVPPSGKTPTAPGMVRIEGIGIIVHGVANITIQQR